MKSVKTISDYIITYLLDLGLNEFFEFMFLIFENAFINILHIPA